MAKFIQRQQKALIEIAAKTPQVRPFAGDTPRDKEERIRRATGEGWEAFEYFCITYFPHIFTKPFTNQHKEMFQETEAASGVIGITGFRGLGKTVLMGVVYPLWKIVKGCQYVIHTAADIDLACERTAFTLNELKENRRLLMDYPYLEVVEGEKDNFYLKNRCRIRARSIKQSHRGTFNDKNMKRPGIIVCDDIDKEENVGSQTIGKRKMDKITQELAGALDPAEPGKVVWLGNLVHPNYAICQFMELIIGEIRADNPELDPRDQKVIKTSQLALLRYSLEDSKAGAHGRSNIRIKCCRS